MDTLQVHPLDDLFLFYFFAKVSRYTEIGQNKDATLETNDLCTLITKHISIFIVNQSYTVAHNNTKVVFGK